MLNQGYSWDLKYNNWSFLGFFVKDCWKGIQSPRIISFSFLPGHHQKSVKMMGISSLLEFIQVINCPIQFCIMAVLVICKKSTKFWPVSCTVPLETWALQVTFNNTVSSPLHPNIAICLMVSSSKSADRYSFWYSH